MLPSSPESIQAFEDVQRGACALVRPPENLTIAEWIDKYAFLSAEGSARPGKWHVSTAEYQRGPLEALSPGSPYETVALMWPSQVGKTQIALGFAGYHIHHDPAPVLFMEPDEGLAKTVSKDRVDPLIRDTPVLRDLVPTGRASGNDIFHKSFPGGHLTLAWASSSSQTASRPIRVLITDEEDRPGYDLNPEGDAIGQAIARLATFEGSRKHLRVSSPGLRRTTKIGKAYDASEKHQFYVPCPQCGHMQTLRWERLKWPPGRPRECYYVCESNGCLITEAHKHRMVRNGEWRADPGQQRGGHDGLTIGYHLNALYSTIGYKWSALVTEYLQCSGVPDKLQVFQNTKLSELWDEQAEGADLNEVAKHAEDYAAQAPAWVLVCTCGTDVQKDRIEATKWGFGLDDVSGVLEHRVFYGDTAVAGKGAWEEYTTWRQLKLLHESGASVPVSRTFIDSGDGNRTQAVYEYCRAHEREGVFACKGSSQPGAPLVSEAKRAGRTRTLLVIVGTSTAKDTLYARLQIPEKGRPGYVHFPRHESSGCGPEFFSHLTAEALVTHQSRAGEYSRWEKLPGRRNEALDCAVYARAAFVFSRAPLKYLARQLAEKAAKLDPAVVAARLEEWRALAECRPASRPSLSSPVSSAASASPTPNQPQAMSKKRKKVLRRPGFGWIHG